MTPSPPTTSPPPLRDRVGALLERLRGEQSKASLARDLGIARQTLMGMERGTWSMTLDRLDELGPALGVEFHVVARRPDGTVVGLPDHR